MAEPTVLDRIVDAVRARMAAVPEPGGSRRSGGGDSRRRRRGDRSARHCRPRGPSIIAECKKASPSAGLLRADFDPAMLAARYQAAGASAISVVTEADFFQGKLEWLAAVR